MGTENEDGVLHRGSKAALAAMACTLALAGCDRNAPAEEPGSSEPSAAPNAEPAAKPSEAVSILRADIEQPEVEAPPLEPLNVVVGFPRGGDTLDEAALGVLRDILASEQMALAGPIVLRAHSDSAGSDRVNADAAEARGMAVAAWLIEQGVAEGRIDVIVFGEQNPVEPNALPDGSANDAGRALNRRVEVLIVPPTGDAGPSEPASTSAAD